MAMNMVNEVSLAVQIDPTGTTAFSMERFHQKDSIGGIELLGTTDVLTFVGPECFHVPATRLMRSKLAHWLENKGLLNVAIIGVGCMLLITSMGVAATSANISVTKDGNTYNATKPRSGPVIVFFVFFLLEWTLMAQRTNRAMFFRCLKSFECMILVASGCVGQTAWHFNLHLIFGSVGSFDFEWQVLELLNALVVVVPCNVMIGTFDSLLLRRKYRLILQGVFIVNILLRYLQTRLGEDTFWITDVVHAWLWHGSLKTIYLASLCQALVFLGKGFISYMLGHPFAHVSAQYKLLEMDEKEESESDLHQSTNRSEMVSIEEIDLENQINSKQFLQKQITLTEQQELTALRAEVKLLRSELHAQAPCGNADVVEMLDVDVELTDIESGGMDIESGGESDETQSSLHQSYKEGVPAPSGHKIFL